MTSRALLQLAAWLLMAAALAATVTVMLLPARVHGPSCLPGMRLSLSEGICTDRSTS